MHSVYRPHSLKRNRYSFRMDCGYVTFLFLITQVESKPKISSSITGQTCISSAQIKNSDDSKF